MLQKLLEGGIMQVDPTARAEWEAIQEEMRPPADFRMKVGWARDACRARVCVCAGECGQVHTHALLCVGQVVLLLLMSVVGCGHGCSPGCRCVGGRRWQQLALLLGTLLGRDAPWALTLCCHRRGCQVVDVNRTCKGTRTGGLYRYR
jgi:hypothetical protein